MKITYDDLTSKEQNAINGFARKHKIKVNRTGENIKSMINHLTDYSITTSASDLSLARDVHEEEVLTLKIPLTEFVEIVLDHTDYEHRATEANLMGIDHREYLSISYITYLKERQLRESHDALKRLHEQYIMMRGLILSGKDIENT